MQASACNNCKVEFLSELWVCSVQGCTAPTIRCRECFPKMHVSDENGKLKTHAHSPFDESSLYRHFLYYVKLYDIILYKFRKDFGGVNHNIEYLCWQIFSTSTIVSNFESPEALGQFYVLKQLYNKRPAQFIKSPGSDLAPSLNLLSEKMFQTNRSQLLAPSEEQKLLAYYFNHLSDSNPQPLEAFIAKEQQQFTAYCESLRQKKQGFNIRDYIKFRRLSKDVNKVYFSRIFQLFLEQKFLQRPEDQEIFTAPEYTTYVWENLQLFGQNPQVAAYFDEWVENYRQYSAFMDTQGLQPTLLAFRMWKNHVPSSRSDTAKDRDKYFLDNFILSFIEHLINSSVYNIGAIVAKNWLEYIQYLRDFAGVTKLKGDEFVDMSKYANYFDFRVKSEDFVNHIKQSEQISFNRDYCVEYLNQTFKDGTKITKKNFKSFVSTKQQQNLNKQKKLQESCQQLQAELQKEEGDKFYKVIFNDYIKDSLKENQSPSKQKYLQFRADVLQRYDEEYIRLSNDKLLLQEKELLEGKKEGDTETEKKGQGKVKYEIDVAEEELAEEVNSNEEEAEANCLCCEGKPEDCTKPECQMMGYCVTCSL